jgi:uracil-DNA glycosylase
MSKLKLVICDTEIDQSWSIKDITDKRPPSTWEKVFEDSKYEFATISETLENEERSYGMYFPLKKNIFAAFELTPLKLVKVVIVGQDPYPQLIVDDNNNSVPRAQGLSFSVSKDDAIPSSLQNIYKELYNTYPGFVIPDHGDLTSWAKQGVLLLNSCLTVRNGKPGSHSELWLGFVKRVCKAIAACNPTCIYLLWGQDAQKIKNMIGEKSVVLEAAHPSGRSANKGFFGCNHFNKANEILIKQGHNAINWYINPPREHIFDKSS